MSNTQLTYIRTAASVILTMLTALLTVYPNEKWSPLIAAAIAGGAVLGIHAIPSVSQNGVTVSENLTGPELMGVRTPPVDAPEPAPEAPEAEPTPEAVPEAAAPELGATVAPDPKQALRDAAQALLEAIENL